MFGLNTSADIYVPDANGDFTQLDRAALPCRLAVITVRPADTGDDRERIGQRRRLLWDADYTMPASAQVEISGRRWNVLDGSYSALTDSGTATHYSRCEVELAL